MSAFFIFAGILMKSYTILSSNVLKFKIKILFFCYTYGYLYR
jgi:hypothetical protein